MSKVIAVFGAGPGLGAAVARRFGSEGYSVALIARRLEPLLALAAELKQSGVEAVAFTAELAKDGQARAVVEAVRERFGHIDAIYYSPASTKAFWPATELSAGLMRDWLELLFLSLVEAVAAVLPAMRSRKSGAILAGFGGSAVGFAHMSGAPSAQAAARNYLQSLRGELEHEGVHVGIVNIFGVVKGSAYHQGVLAGEDDAPPDFEMPIVDPEDLARHLWLAASGDANWQDSFPSE
jgi:short-subunit dehydrogenase